MELPLLEPAMTDEQVIEGCELAERYGIASVTVWPSEVDLALRTLGGTAVRVASAVGYPYGLGTTAGKLYEGRELLRRGVKEIEFTLNVAKMRSRQFAYNETELLQMAESCAKAGAAFKVAIEAADLAFDLQLIALKICKRVGADYAVNGGPEAVDPMTSLRVMKEHQGFRLQLKAQGQISGLAEALACKELGCTRIGSTAVAAILDAWKAEVARVQPPAEVSPIT